MSLYQLLSGIQAEVRPGDRRGEVQVRVRPEDAWKLTDEDRQAIYRLYGRVKLQEAA